MKLMNSSEFRTWMSYLLLIVCGIAAYVAINNLSAILSWVNILLGYLSPFFAGIVIAYLLDIPCTWIEKLLKTTGYKFIEKHARGFAVIISYACFIALIILTMRVLIPEIVKNIKEFVLNYRVYFQNAVDFITDITNDENFLKTLGYESVISELSVKSIIDAIGYNSIWQSIVGILSVSAYLFNFLIAVVSSMYLLLEARTIAAFFSKVIRAFVSEKKAAILFKYLRSTNQYFNKFIYCTLIDGFIIGVASVVGLSVAGTQYAVVLGILEGVTNMIPYFGAIVGSVIVVVIVLLTDGVGQAVVVALFLFILQQIDGNIIKIKLYGDSFQISPFLVLISITLGGAFYGVIGMVVAIPAVAVLKLICDDALNYKLKRNAERGW